MTEASSISSSDPDVNPSVALPQRPMGYLLLAAAVVVLMGLTVWEMVARSYGFKPDLEDSVELWSSERLRTHGLAQRALALVGSSRFQLGIDPVALGAELPAYIPVQLASDGWPALPMLKDLAGDPEFRGSVLVEVTPAFFFPVGAVQATARMQEWMRHAHERPFVAPLELELRLLLRSHVVIRQSALRPRGVLTALLGGHFPDRPYVTLRRDRFRSADYSRVDTVAMREHWKQYFSSAVPPTQVELRQLVRRLIEWVAALRQRGGEVIFVRMISSSPVLDVEDQAFPAQSYWQTIVDAGLKALEFREIPGTEHLACPDGSHLDAAGALQFSAALGAELRRRLMFPPSERREMAALPTR